MKTATEKTIALIVMVLLSPIACSATETEFLYGLYTYRSSDLSFEFHLTDGGITHFRSNDFVCPTLSWNPLGDLRNTSVYELTCKQTERRYNLVRLFVFFARGKVLKVSGLYADIEYQKPKEEIFEVRMVRTIEMKFTPLSEIEKPRKQKEAKKQNRPTR
ncbi:MAG: hypothetical protein M1453_10460 [Acidobacteria bacterium]|nr:hypothetical protein [Acidobacteriota bacterium]MCL5288400.1 hypothetical protein [Acidobacteriota bacterium]